MNIKMFLLFGLFSTGTVWANGGGYNGPDLAGISVPVTVDRALSKADLIRALTQCNLEAAIDIGQQLFHTLPTRQKVWESATRVDGGSYFFLYELYFGDQRARFDFSSDQIVMTFFREPTSAGETVRLESGETSPEVLIPFPVFIYDAEIPDSAYDELGRPVVSRVILKDLKLLYPSNYGANLKLINGETKHATSFLFNEEKIVDCYLANLQGDIE